MTLAEQRMTVQLANRPHRRRQPLAIALIAAAGLTVAGCSFSSSSDGKAAAGAGPTAAASPAATGSPQPTALPSIQPGVAVDGAGLFNKIDEALAASGGCTVKVTINDKVVSTGVFSFGPRQKAASKSKPSLIGRTLSQGTITSSDQKTTQYVMKIDSNKVAFDINDGQATAGKAWAQVPLAVSQVQGFTTLIKTRPMIGFVPDFVPRIDPEYLATSISTTTPVVAGRETADGVLTLHYLWNSDPSVKTAPAAGSPTTFQTWIDQQGRPVAFLFYANSLEVHVEYSQWGRHAVQPPDTGDVSVLPTVKPTG